jgi:hypothetical protein
MSFQNILLFYCKQELLGQFSSTVEQKLYQLNDKNYEKKIDFKFISEETNKIKGKN